jgi:hypothetical protein
VSIIGIEKDKIMKEMAFVKNETEIMRHVFKMQYISFDA